ncbi:MAG: autoinducer synthase [Hyphomicrobium sp.]|nr:autoinducer synthase [Hyphomicrobium sp.]
MNVKSELLAFPTRRAPNADDPRNNADAFEIRLLSDRADISGALQLRHRAYASQDLIPRQDAAEYRDDHDLLPTTAIMGGFDQGSLVASMRLCFCLPGDDLSTLPCASYYPALSELGKNARGGLVEVSRLATEPDVGTTSYRATLYGFMVRSAFAAARAAGVSAVVVATRGNWVPYYKHLLQFQQVGEPAFYPPGNIPITLLAGKIEQASRRAELRNRFFKVSEDDVARMRRMLAPVLLPEPAAAVAGAER